jgi:hypothetical protein
MTHPFAVFAHLCGFALNRTRVALAQAGFVAKA